MELRYIPSVAMLTFFTSIIPSIIVFILIKIDTFNKTERFFYSFIGAFISGFIFNLFTIELHMDSFKILLASFIGSLLLMIFLKKKYATKVLVNNDLIKKDFSKITEMIKEYSFITFIKQNANFYYIIIFFLVSTFSMVVPTFLKIDLNSGFNFSEFHKLFYILFFLNLLPWIFLIYLSYDVRKKIQSSKEIKAIDYFVTVIIGAIFVGLSLIPILFVLLIISSQLNLFKPNSPIDPSYFTIILLPLMFIVTFYAIGASTNIILNMSPTFKIKKTLFVFKKPFIQFLLKWSLLFLIIPLLFPTICFKLNMVFAFNKYIYFYLSLVSSLTVTYITLYFVKLFESESFEL